MKLALSHPHLSSIVDNVKFLEAVDGSYIHALLSQLAAYYDEQLALWQVLSRYGIHHVGPNDDLVQVPCLLPEHGTGDTHKSARYYKTDRNTGEDRASVYCFKCEKAQTAFWYVYHQERSMGQKVSVKDVLRALVTKFGIPIPRDLILNFDPESHYTLDDGFENRATTAAKLLPEIDVLIGKRNSLPNFLSELNQVIKGL